MGNPNDLEQLVRDDIAERRRTAERAVIRVEKYLAEGKSSITYLRHCVRQLRTIEEEARKAEVQT